MSDLAESPTPSSAQKTAESYSIRVASRLTSIPADTLRMWERRYGFPSPQRKATGVRSYTYDDIERLLLVSRSLRLGYRPGEVVSKSKPELEQLLASASSRSGAVPRSPFVQVCVDAIVRFDPSALAVELRRALAVMGEKQFLLDVASPLVQRVRELWIEGQVGVRHERLLASILSAQIQKLISTYEATARVPSFLLTTLPGEPPDVLPEMAALLIAVHGGLPRWLSDMPPDQIVDAAQALKADVVCVPISEASNIGAASSQLRWVLGALPAPRELWLTGNGAERIDIRDERVHLIKDWAVFEQQLERVRSGRLAAGNGASHVGVTMAAGL